MSALATGPVILTCVKCGDSHTCDAATEPHNRPLLDWWYVDREQRCRACADQADDVIAGGARSADSETSKAAAIHELGRRGNQRERLLFVYYQLRHDVRGITDEAAYQRANIEPKSSPWRRCTELRDNLGMTEATGETKITSSGCAADCHRITPKGIEALIMRGLVTT